LLDSLLQEIFLVMPEKSETRQTCQVVAWDLDTTGRKLIDEICQIGGYFRTHDKETEDNTFSQYVMPYRNPNPGARRSFGIKVVNIGRYRMLKDLNTGKILKTKSEVSALQDFISWLGRARGQTDGVILICHEPERKVLVPLLIQALHKYNLIDSFNSVVKGFCNSSEAISDLGDQDKITSLSLRSLCKTVLSNTTMSTASAVDRSKVLVDIMANVTHNCIGDTEAGNRVIIPDKLEKFTTTVQHEEMQLTFLKNVLGTQGTLRPIFESHLKQKRLVRNKAMELRREMAEAGLDYKTIESAFKNGSLREKIETIKAPTDDIDEIIKLINDHFTLGKSDSAVNGNSQ